MSGISCSPVKVPFPKSSVIKVASCRPPWSSVVAREGLRALLRGGLNFRVGRTLQRRLVAHAVTVRGPDERCKQRVRRERLRLVLGVELTTEEPGVRLARQLYLLD